MRFDIVSGGDSEMYAGPGFGPYFMWHHEHFIRKIEGGVEMEDLLHYKLPLGFIGQIVHQLIIKRKLQEIFDYRQQKLDLLFGNYD